MKVDCWSLGILLFELLSGEYPFNTSGKETELFTEIVKGTFTFNENWDTISANAKDLVKNLLEKDPKKRYSMSQVRDHAWMQEF